jgi:hypothetical protein
VWASLLKGKTAVIQEVAEEMNRRDPSRSMARLALTDGERALHIRVDQKLNVTLILDLMQVLQKLCKAAYVFHAEGSLEADLWVPNRTLPILFGQVGLLVILPATRGSTAQACPRCSPGTSYRPEWSRI